MRHLVYSLVAVCLMLGVAAPAQPRKKVAVVLSGGGAKGAAHIGALKVIEKAGIPIDYVVGTSMGSIIGGLYSIGYSTAQLDSLMRGQDWMFLLTDATSRKEKLLVNKQRSELYTLSVPFKKSPKDALRGGIVQGRNLARLFSELTEGYHDSLDFNRLPIPFACVAHNLAKGSEYVFHSGKLALAMRASMSIPGAFQPVRWNGMVLVDGGLSNNYPVDIAKEMGADVIIGVDVQEGLASADKLNTLTGVVEQLVNLMVENKYADNVARSDLHIKVPAGDYSAASFSTAAIDTLIERGERTAMAQWDSLLLLREKIGLPLSYMPKPHGPFLAPKKEKYDVIPEIDPGERSANSLSVGVRFDNESLASLICNSTIFLDENKSRDVALTARLGRSLFGQLDYTVRPFHSKWELRTSYKLAYNDLDLYQNGKKGCTYSFLHHVGQFGISRSWRDIRVSLGARYENFHFKDFLLPLGNTNVEAVENEDFVIYYGKMQFDSYDKRTYPTSGMKWEAEASAYTDDFVKYNDNRPMFIVRAQWEAAIRLRNRTTLIPWVCGRAIYAKGNLYSFPVMNVVGGSGYGRYLSQQMPFVGITHMQMMGAQVLIGGFNLRQHIGSSQYLTLTTNAGFQKRGTGWEHLFGNDMWGGGISYGYDTFLGPIECTFSYSNVTKDLGLYLSWGYHF